MRHFYVGDNSVEECILSLFTAPVWSPAIIIIIINTKKETSGNRTKILNNKMAGKLAQRLKACAVLAEELSNCISQLPTPATTAPCPQACVHTHTHISNKPMFESNDYMTLMLYYIQLASSQCYLNK